MSTIAGMLWLHEAFRLTSTCTLQDQEPDYEPLGVDVTDSSLQDHYQASTEDPLCERVEMGKISVISLLTNLSDTASRVLQSAQSGLISNIGRTVTTE